MIEIFGQIEAILNLYDRVKSKNLFGLFSIGDSLLSTLKLKLQSANKNMDNRQRFEKRDFIVSTMSYLKSIDDSNFKPGSPDFDNLSYFHKLSTPDIIDMVEFGEEKENIHQLFIGLIGGLEGLIQELSDKQPRKTFGLNHVFVGMGLMMALISIYAFQVKGDSKVEGNTQTIEGANNGVMQQQTAETINIYNGGSNDNTTSYSRPSHLLGLNRDETIEFFYSSMNNGEYQQACSLLRKSSCNPNEEEDYLELESYKSTLVGGYKLYEVIDTGEGMGGQSLMCVKYGYRKYKNEDTDIYYHHQFRLEKDSDGERVIFSRIPEKKFTDYEPRPLEKKATDIKCHGKYLL